MVLEGTTRRFSCSRCSIGKVPLVKLAKGQKREERWEELKAIIGEKPVNKMASEVQSLAEKVNELAEHNKQLGEKVGKQEEEIADLAKKLSVCRLDADKTREEKFRMKAEMKQLKQDLRIEREGCEQLSSKKKEVEEKLKTAISNNDSLRKEIGNKQRGKTELEEENNQLRVEIDEVQKKWEEDRKEKETQVREISELRSRLSACLENDKDNNDDNEIVELKETIKHLNEYVTLLKEKTGVLTPGKDTERNVDRITTEAKVYRSDNITDDIQPSTTNQDKRIEPKTICWNFEKWGNCRYGSSCMYAHESRNVRNIANRKLVEKRVLPLCWQYEETGECARGLRCKFRHEYTDFENKLYSEGRYVPSYERNKRTNRQNYMLEYNSMSRNRLATDQGVTRGNSYGAPTELTDLHKKVDFLLQKMRAVEDYQQKGVQGYMMQGQEISNVQTRGNVIMPGENWSHMAWQQAQPGISSSIPVPQTVPAVPIQ